MTGAAPRRVVAAVERLAPAPDARVLEVGCGTGAGLELLAARVVRGRVTGIDRSATAVARARERVAHLADRVGVHQLALADLPVGSGPYDAVLAVNVNVFWTTSAEVEVARLRDVVTPDGRVLLVYELPPGGGASEDGVGDRAAEPFRRAGWSVDATADDGLVLVAARLSAEAPPGSP